LSGAVRALHRAGHGHPWRRDAQRVDRDAQRVDRAGHAVRDWLQHPGCKAAFPHASKKKITAKYSGDSTHEASSGTVTVTIKRR
jgi:hypothetical protein